MGSRCVEWSAQDFELCLCRFKKSWMNLANLISADVHREVLSEAVSVPWHSTTTSQGHNKTLNPKLTHETLSP